MSTSRVGELIWHIVALQLCPLVSVEVKQPYIIQLVVILIFSSEDHHVVTVLNRTVAGSRRRTCTAELVHLLPFIVIEVVPIDFLGSHSIYKSSENNHTSLIYDSGVFIP